MDAPEQEQVWRKLSGLGLGEEIQISSVDKTHVVGVVILESLELRRALKAGLPAVSTKGQSRRIGKGILPRQWQLDV